jgi:hypothetical protein
MSCLVLNDFSGLRLCHGAKGACPRLMGFPGRPPGFVPGVEPGKDRLRSFERHLPDGAVCAAVDFFDDECAPRNGSEIGIELTCVFHFLSPLIIVF